MERINTDYKRRTLKISATLLKMCNPQNEEGNPLEPG